MAKHIKLIEKLICKTPVYKGGAVNFNADRVRMLNGKTATREYIDHPGAVAVLPLLGGKVVLVRQYRHPIGEATWEIPAGKLHFGHDAPLNRAKLELQEETGYRTKRLKKLLSFWPCCAFSNELLHIYWTDDLEPGPPSPDEDEFLRVKAFPLKKALMMIRTGKIKDSKTIIALLAWQAMRRA